MNFWQLWRKNRLRNKGQKYLVKGFYHKAFRIFQKVLLLDDAPENIFNLAITLMSLGNYPEAENYLQKVYKKFPENELNILSLAECNLMQKKWEKAKKLYDKLQAVNPNKKFYLHYQEIAYDPAVREKYVTLRLLINQADKAIQKKNKKSALTFLEQCEEYLLSEPNLLHSIGVLYYQLKNYKKARSFLAEAVKLDNSNSAYKKILRKVIFKLDSEK